MRPGWRRRSPIRARREALGRAGVAGAAAAAFLAVIGSVLPACEGEQPVNPFTTGTLSGGPGAGGAGGGSNIDPELGGPCVDDAQCNDGVGCTFDRCDQELSRCRFTRV